MQDAELFFQAADHRHLFLYIDGLAETEARRQTDVCNYARKRLDDYEALQKNIERLEQELQQEKDANALLQTQLAQQSREAAVHSSRKTTTEDKQAGTAPAQDSAEDRYRLGEQYACGEGVPRNGDIACQWYAKAAAQGHDAGLSILKQLTEQGDADAQFRLGDMYKEGKGVPRDNDM
ncbi:MAG TPA: SEL1-like repeat protein, partial [Candidatus Desulfovibrio intestinigallinarum]|nr:SEL1-like repeat protein [Candidatus Desulfovibrio intestinigallinarum]